MKNAYAKERAELRRQRLRYICRDHPEDFVPREERYPNVKVPGMGKNFKAEPIGGKVNEKTDN